MNSLELLERRPASAPSAVAGAGTGCARGMTRQKADSVRNFKGSTTGTSGIQGRSRGPSLGSRDIIETTKGILDDIDKSPFFTKNKAKRNPRFRHEEIKTGPILGKGEYSIVREVTAFDITDSCPICVIHNFKESADSSSGSMKASESSDQMFDRNAKKKEVSVNAHTRNANRHESELNLSGMYIAEDNVSDSDMNSFQDDHEEEDHEDVANRGFMKHHCFRDGSARYAIKQLKSTLTGTKRADGAIDLAIEAKFLSVLCGHPNIIKLCGLGGTSGHPNSFIILDRLYDTLDVKIDYWKAKEDEYTGFLGMKKHKPQLKLLFNERLLAGYDIGRAVKYLHSNDIIYRDLKPENIGFDVLGNAKIFDFGLAKELRDKDKVATNQYKASGRTGTRRYMAPEVVLCKYYGKPVDVFSFSILLWEILSLTQPFKGFQYEKHTKLVVQKGFRPPIKNEWPTLIKHVLKEAWRDDPAQRPTFDQICNSLAGEVSDSDSVHGIDGMSRTERLLDRSVLTRDLEMSLNLAR
jgi:serine/threonine protein kinase